MIRFVNRTSLASIAVVLLATTCASPTAARDRIVRVTERVPYADLDLTSAQGARDMLQRIEAAVERACAEPLSGTLPWADTYARQCRAKALPRAVANLHAPLVSAEYARLNPEPPAETAAR